MKIKVDARRIKKGHVVIKKYSDGSIKHCKVVDIKKEKRNFGGGDYFPYKKIIYSDNTSDYISLNPRIIGGWETKEILLKNLSQVMFLPYLNQAIDKWKFLDYGKIILVLVIIILILLIIRNCTP